MLKIAILTQYYKNANYGGILQAFALQKFLQDSGYKAEQISYVLDSGYPGYNKRKLMGVIKLIVKKAIRQEWYLKNSKFENKLYEFAESIPHTRTLEVNQLGELVDEFDAFIVGSDQVWNPIGWQPTFFFDFLPAGKFCMSYAASIARYELSDSEAEFIKDNIKKFSYISVREKESAILLKDIIDQEVKVMPDPTFLIDSKEWEEIAAGRIVNDKYVFAYFLGNNLSQRDEAIKFAEEKGLKIYFIPYMKKDWFEWDKQHINYMLEDIGIPEFLSLIKYAECVITDSFHGTVFSLIFGVPFFTYSRFKVDDKKSMNSRIDTLLSMFNMCKRTGTDLPGYIDVINRGETKTVLNSLKRQGADFLEESLKRNDMVK